MDKRIVYKRADGGMSVIIPATETGLTVEQIATKDVPTGLPYKIIKAADVPSDRSQRDQWTVADEDLTDGVGA